MAAPTTEVVRTLDGARALAPEWRTLADDVFGSPFLQPAVALAWWEHLGRGELAIVTARDAGGRLMALAPLHERRLGPLTVARWLGFGLGAVGELLVRPGADDAAAAVWATAADGPRRVLHLVECRHGGAGIDALRRDAPWAVHAELRDACPVVDVRGHRDVASFLAEPGRRKLRQNLARYDRQAERDGRKVTVDVHETGEDVTAVLADLTRVHDRAEAHRPKLHFLAGEWRAFTVAALAAAAAEERLAVFVLRVDDEPVGFHVVLTAGRVAYAWLARADPAAADFAPGHLMLRAVVGWAAERGLDTVDLQLGDDAYKLRWSSSTYDTLGVVAAAPGRLAPTRAALAGLDGLYRARAAAGDRLGQRGRTRASV